MYAYIDGNKVTSYTDANPMLSGRVKISSNWTQVYADNLEIKTVKGGIPYATAMIDGQDDGVAYNGTWAINNPGGGSADNWYLLLHLHGGRQRLCNYGRQRRLRCHRRLC